MNPIDKAIEALADVLESVAGSNNYGVSQKDDFNNVAEALEALRGMQGQDLEALKRELKNGFYTCPEMGKYDPPYDCDGEDAIDFAIDHLAAQGYLRQPVEKIEGLERELRCVLPEDEDSSIIQAARAYQKLQGE